MEKSDYPVVRKFEIVDSVAYFEDGSILELTKDQLKGVQSYTKVFLLLKKEVDKFKAILVTGTVVK